MLLKTKTNVQGEWLKKKEDIKDGDIITILNGGTESEGQHGLQYVFSLQTKNGAKNAGLNQTTLNNLISAFGEDTQTWITKEVKVWLLKIMVSGKLVDVLYLTEPTWVMAEDGSFLKLDKQAESLAQRQPQQEPKQEQIPVVEYPQEEIKAEDIPF